MIKYLVTAIILFIILIAMAIAFFLDVCFNFSLMWIVGYIGYTVCLGLLAMILVTTILELLYSIF